MPSHRFGGNTVLVRFNPPPGWPVPPGWAPPPGWDPDPTWPPAPPGWQFWVEVPPTPAAVPPHPHSRGDRTGSRTGVVAGAVVGIGVLTVALVLGLTQLLDQAAQHTTLVPPSGTEGTEGTDPTAEPTEPPAPATPTEPETYTTTHPETGMLTADVGMCTDQDYLTGDTITELPLFACAHPHDAEVVATFDLTGGDYPGDGAVVAQAEGGCADAFEEYVGIPYEESELGVRYLSPNDDSWTQDGDREIICLAYLAEGSDTGSWQGTRR